MTTISSELITPGTITSLGDFTQFNSFEDAVASTIAPAMSPEQQAYWDARISLRERVRPPRFNGPLLNILLSAMDEPFEELATVEERGLKFVTGESIRLQMQQGEHLADLRRLTRGFMMTADARSSREGIVGQILAELYYVPVPRHKSHQFGRGSVRRIMTRPQWASSEFIRSHREARQVGHDVLRFALQHSQRSLSELDSAREHHAR